MKSVVYKAVTPLDESSVILGWRGTIHKAVMTSLTPHTKYYYRVGDGDDRWSDVFNFNTLYEGQNISYAIIAGHLDYIILFPSFLGSLKANMHRYFFYTNLLCFFVRINSDSDLTPELRNVL